MNVRATCPFCNAVVIAAAATRVCPRCDQPFTAEWTATEELVAAKPPTTSPSPTPKWPFVVAVFAVLAAVVYFNPFRPEAKIEPKTTEAATMPPAALAGLKYLPQSSNIVFAMQPAATMRFQDVDRGDHRTLWSRLGLPAVLSDVFAAIGPDDVDQIVVGATVIIEKPIPGVTIYVKFRNDANSERLKESLDMQKKPHAGRAVFDTKLKFLVATPLDARTWLLGVSADDLASADAPKGGVLEKDIAALDPASYAWLVTARQDWSGRNVFAKPYDTKLKNLRGVTASMGMSGGTPKLLAVIDLADEATAAEVAKAIDRAVASGTRVTVARDDTPTAAMEWIQEQIKKALR